MRLSVDEETWSALHPIADSACDVRFNPRQALLFCEIGTKRVFIEADCNRMRREVLIRQRALAVKQQVVHLPELALELRRLRGEGGMQGMGMDFSQREVAKGVDEGVAQLAANLRDADQGLARVRAFIVAVDQQSHRRAGCSAHVVTCGDVGRQPGIAHHQLLSRARSVPPLASSASISAMTSSESVKSKTPAFSAMRSRWVDFGMTIRPCCRHQRMSTWAGVRPTRDAILLTAGSARWRPVPSGL